jgi:alkylhydroperoxidase/carboxymuconolactone decarboxylase family protein YurZ
MAADVPTFANQFRKSHPEIWKAFNDLAGACHESGPLDEKSRRLVKVALCVGAAVEGGAHSAARNARTAGVTQAELDHVALLAITTLGFPAAMRARAWLSDASGKKPSSTDSRPGK